MDNIRKALAELVELKKLKEQFDVLKQDVPDVATAAVLEGMAAEYQRRQPLAWDAARAALAEQPSVRKPLTDARIVELAEYCGYDGAVPTVRLAFQGFKLWEFARTVEAAHGIGVKGEA